MCQCPVRLTGFHCVEIPVMTSESPDTRPLTEVAVGIVSRPDGQVLLAQRPAGKPYAGWWEFPGGKFEPGETAAQAIARELEEELGIVVGGSSAWLVREHAYEHARVRLHFRRIHQFSGEPESREAQAFGWYFPDKAQVSPLLPATVPLMRLLCLPPVYAISAAHLVGVDGFLAQLDLALEGGLRLLQLREPGLPDDVFESLFTQTLQRCRAHGARLLVNSQHPQRFWALADGVHLRAADLHAGQGRQSATAWLQDHHWIAASCHSAEQLRQAARAQVDFAVLGPVQPTRSHPGQSPLGWPAFSQMTELTPLPVYALGGLGHGELSRAISAGAHGVAMIRGVFTGPGDA